MATRRSAPSAAAGGDVAGGTPIASKGHHYSKHQPPQTPSIPESEGGARMQGDVKPKLTSGGFIGAKPLLLGFVM